jgi:hypothetical protein
MKSFCLGLLFALLTQTLRAEPLAVDPVQLEYNLRTTLEAYNQVGHKNAKWDNDARKALETFARIRSWTNGNAMPLLDEIWTNTSRALSNGCDDPMIQYFNLRYVTNLNRTNAAIAFSRAAADLQKCGYPEVRVYYASMWALKNGVLVNPKKPSLTALAKATGEHLAKALEDKTMPLKEADEACDVLIAGECFNTHNQWAAFEPLAPVLASRWKDTSFALLIKGRAYTSYAWLARGNGFADTVSETGWKDFAARLELAASSLEEAWRLNSQDVRICLAMMNVELGQGQGRKRMEFWFQRGLRLDAGNRKLCDFKMWYLYPRWYGSHEEMIEFGRECTDNPNWTGEVRLMLAEAHDLVAKEIQDKEQRRKYYEQPEVWRDIQHTYEQFFKLYPERVGYRHNYALMAAKCCQAQVFLDQTKLFPCTNFNYFGGVEQFNATVKSAKDHLEKK